MRLEGKIAIVCGSSGRIGRAVSLLFAQEGAKLSLVTRRKESIAGTVGIISRAGGQALVIEANPTGDTGAKKLVEETVSAFGRVDIVFYGVGGYISGDVPATATDEVAWDAMLKANLLGAFHVCRHAIPELVKGGGGSIVLVSAAYGARQAGNVAYAASKEAVIGMARRLAREYRDESVRINVILPLYVPEGTDADRIAPVKGTATALCRPEDIAYGALYLASDEARFVTGQILPIDGGDGL